ncbi:acyl-CoA dehydrogenase family protein [Candidatus Leptofilum sp.]|uniref:acyl-CoA dehydrogenase family protein n=1 Tax=Candidatus Leptofilum sp. TaxID=3241576 RepID=UPI003B5CE772
MQPFNQSPPSLGNQFDDDRVLRSYLRRVLPPEVLTEVERPLREMGALAGGDLYQMQLADRLNEPVLTQWDPWGNRIDEIEVSPLWQKAEKLAAEHGVVAAAYEGKYGRFDRIYQFALAYLFHPSTDVYTCPLAMTDGAARTLLTSGNQELIDRAVPHLTSRDPAHFWTSGQWMTESTGGSDVGLSETVAKLNAQEEWLLYGRKWFTSAATSQMTLTLARPEGNPPGGKGLALFYLETHEEDGSLQNIEVLRLKDKLGTRKVPTAELMLHGTTAVPVMGLNNGVRNIVPMLHLTRTWNSISAAAFMRRGMALARSYAQKRIAFGAPLAEKPLHLDTLAEMQAETEAAFHLTFFLVELIGKDEAGEISEEEAHLLRLLTSLAKLTTGKQAVVVASEVLEAFGGAGYVEDTGLPLLLRDGQVLPIWEGTTNVLSLDALRALGSSGEPLLALSNEVDRCVGSVTDGRLNAAGEVAQTAVAHAMNWLQSHLADRHYLEAGARRFALTLGRALALAKLIEQAQWSLDVEGDGRPRAAACRFAKTAVNRIQAINSEDALLLADDM